MNKISKENLPQHIVIVPDGNRRWAKQKGLAPWRGHIAGAKKTKEQIQTAFDLGLKCISWWGGSWDNLTKRSKIEINNLFRIYERYFRELIKKKEIYQHNVKVNVIGRWSEIMPKKGIKTVNELIEKTKNHTERKLNFFIAYDGRDEMLAAIKSIIKEAKENRKLKITKDLLRSHLWTHDLPPVDLLIRTGSSDDPHNSAGFMMWHTAHSQLCFPKGFYPDFGRKEFIKVIKEYQRRERRLGK
ncbi:di-trans,poly-cis-decaprenylcistransferase [Patescibacteria group bacterium]|nr:di-trans,poly-cis-decaprenylcistransferase [Patescibacteria group bacterium]MBU1563893.1 di-trans,poly-cis-decaprenylcistransferase [Patescibacteria group bacterium]MBU2068122.1 di-trans,poly-cis-decaprenylcistransferase [Patescibacteria group bacterium]